MMERNCHHWSIEAARVLGVGVREEEQVHDGGLRRADRVVAQREVGGEEGRAGPGQGRVVASFGPKAG